MSKLNVQVLRISQIILGKEKLVELTGKQKCCIYKEVMIKFGMEEVLLP